MIKIKQKGDFEKTIKCFKKLKQISIGVDILNECGEKGVRALSSATPVGTGKTADSWYYTIKSEPDRIRIAWCNSNENDGVLIAILLQYGHATGTGGYVIGKDYINPAIRPVFDEMLAKLGRELKEA